MYKDIELLAPAGSYESLKAAVNAGADAVYMGGSRFGARAYAQNPEQEDLCRGIRFAHLHGCKLYLTVNTLLKDQELSELGAYLKPYYESGVDAVIVQDFGVFSYLREYFPDLPIHASTQMTILGSEGASFLKELGASRIVTARELSLSELREIHQKVDIEIESFIHGALCYCYSGQCLFSSMLGGRSGNRGRCAQPCRLPYQLKEKGRTISSPKEPYLLSPKDMCTIELLPEIIEAGVCSLKIEGRMKRPEYTAGVVRIYRKYLDDFLIHGKEGYRVSEEDYRELETLYNRGGFSQGYYKVQNGRNLISLSRPNHFEKKGKEALAKKQAYEALLADLNKNYVETEKKEKIWGSLFVSPGLPVELTVSCRKALVKVTGEAAQEAKKQPATRESLERQLQKTGGTPFVFESLEIQMEKESFVPVQQLNQIRREALRLLEKKLSSSDYRTLKEIPAERPEPPSTNHPKASFPIHVELSDPETLSAVLPFSEVSKIYLDSERLAPEKMKDYVSLCREAGKDCVLVLPAIFRQKARAYFEKHEAQIREAGFHAVVIKNLEELGFLKKAGWKLPMILDHNLYLFNQRALNFWKEQNWGEGGFLYDTLPLELNERELSLRGCEDSEMLVYGHLPLMVTAGCLHKTVNRCQHKTGLLTLTDRYQKEFPVLNYCRYCYNVIYNCAPLSLLGSRPSVERLNPKSLRLSFTIEGKKEIAKLLTQYIDVYCYGRERQEETKDFTRGHLKRGVE